MNYKKINKKNYTLHLIENDRFKTVNISLRFTKKYNVDKLVFYEKTGSIMTAILREKQIKSWSRKKKNDLIDSINPRWVDLSLSNE